MRREIWLEIAPSTKIFWLHSGELQKKVFHKNQFQVFLSFLIYIADSSKNIRGEYKKCYLQIILIIIYQL